MHLIEIPLDLNSGRGIEAEGQVQIWVDRM